MLYISTKLTLVMLAVVPPISLGAVSPNRAALALFHYCINSDRRLPMSLPLQVFYGRYLRKLSKQTQEALGDMTKVGRPGQSVRRLAELP